MFKWKLHVWHRDGSFFRTLTSGDMHGIESIQRASLTPAGDCREMEFTASPIQSGIRARHIIQWEVSDNGGRTYRKIWKGVVTRAGNPRNPGLTTYRAVGLRKRMRERVIQRWFCGEQDEDLVQRVRQAFETVTDSGMEPQYWSWPAGVSFITSNAPALGFVVGPTFPRMQIAGEYLDNLLELVGKFVVASGETYTYNGKTWSAGQEVPACEWGVNANGAFFFKRPVADAVAANEVDDYTEVDWLDIQAENVADQVVMVYVNDPGEGWMTPNSKGVKDIPEPIFRTYGDVDGSGNPTGDLDAQRLVVLDNPADLMKEASITLQGAGTWVDFSNVNDGDESSYTSLNDTSGQIRAVTNGTGPVLLRMRFWPQAQREMDIWATNWSYTRVFGRYVFDVEPGVQTVYFPILNTNPDLDPATDDTGVRVNVNGFASGDRVYELELLVPDEDISEQIAEGFMRKLENEPSEVRTYRTLGNLADRMNLTTIEGTTLDRRIDRVEYRYSPAQGFVTAYMLEQRETGGGEQLQEVLDAIIRRGASKEAQSQLRSRSGANWRS